MKLRPWLGNVASAILADVEPGFQPGGRARGRDGRCGTSEAGPCPGRRQGCLPLLGGRSHGFTLVEVLVALGILGMVLTAIFSSWTSILRSSKVGLEAAAAVQRARIAVRTVETALQGAQMFESNLTNYLFEVENGNAATISFTAHLPDSFPRGGRWPGLNIRRVKFSIEPGPDSSQQLVLRQKPLLADTQSEFDEDEMNHPLVLARYVSSFELEFLDQRSGDWTDEWKQMDQLPKLVKFRLRLSDNPHARGSRREDQVVVRYVSLPSVKAMRMWQLPMGPPGAPGAGGVPAGGTPSGGVPPGGVPPGGVPPGGFGAGGIR